jgi:hypothetical protein
MGRFSTIPIYYILVFCLFFGCADSNKHGYNVKYFDAETDLEITQEQVRNKKHYQSYFNENGDEVERYYFNRTGELDFCFLEVSKIEYVYDTRGNMISESYFGKKGDTEIDTDGIHRQTFEYDTRNNLIAVDYFDKNGDGTLPTSGTYRDVHRIEYKYDINDNRTAEVFFGLSNGPTNNFLGYHRTVTEYEYIAGEFRRMSTSYYNLDNTPGTNGYGIFCFENDYNDEGRLISRGSFDENGVAVNNEDLIHMYEYYYDEDGKLIEEFAYGKNGDQVWHRKIDNNES